MKLIKEFLEQEQPKVVTPNEAFIGSCTGMLFVGGVAEISRYYIPGDVSNLIAGIILISIGCYLYYMLSKYSPNSKR